PLLLLYFNRVSWVAPIANLVVVPLSSVVLAFGLLLPLGPLPGLALLLEAVRPSAQPLCGAPAGFAAVPSAWQSTPGPPAPLVVVVIGGLALWSFLGWRRAWIAGLGSALVVASTAAGLRIGPRPAAGLLRLSFLDVGQGDAIVLELPD